MMSVYHEKPGMYDPTDPNSIDAVKGLVFVFVLSVGLWIGIAWVFGQLLG